MLSKILNSYSLNCIVKYSNEKRNMFSRDYRNQIQSGYLLWSKYPYSMGIWMILVDFYRAVFIISKTKGGDSNV